MRAYLRPLPLIRERDRSLPPKKINLPFAPESLNYFYSSPYVFVQHKEYALLTSKQNDNFYKVHDNTKVVGYIVMGEFYDFKRFY
jgi:hypothetical protein